MTDQAQLADRPDTFRSITAATGDTPLTGIALPELLNANAADDPQARNALRFLSYREKFLAGSWRFDTYFGRDTLMSVRLLMPVLQPTAIEAGLGALWGEEPRYIPSGRRKIGERARYVIKTTFLTQRPDGHLAPAWGRYAGNVFNNLIENAWLPPSVTTPGQTVTRSLLGMASRLGGNAWDEFWPDAWRLFRKRISKP